MNILLLCAAVLAQEGIEVDFERFRPAADTYGYAVVESAATLEHLQVGVSLWGGFGLEPFHALYVPGGPVGRIEHRSTTDFQVGMGISRYFSFSASWPFVLWQTGSDLTHMVGGDYDASSSGIGDLRLTPKFVLVDQDYHPIGLAVLGRVSLPTGQRQGFVGAGSVNGAPMVVLEAADGSVRKREYRVRFALNLGMHFRSPVATDEALLLQNEFMYRAGLAAHPVSVLEIGFEAYGHVGWNPRAYGLETVGWFKFHGLDLVTVTVGGGPGFFEGVGTPSARVFLGATLAPSFDPKRLDRDGDGIPNKTDNCINIPEDHDGFEDEDGCPEHDNDLDGIVDKSDHCP
ncbi:MAG: hypothetical protein HN348_00265, partial [Proteobacteria bacterium]|nr:hypothetical protein [Pseudomonadota bacterium]